MGTALTRRGYAVRPPRGQPGYRKGVVTQGATRRANPDVAYDADYHTGFAVYATVPYNGQTGWFDAGGTSAGTPQWAALVALANLGRARAVALAAQGVAI